MALADDANRYVANMQPWALAKDQPQSVALQEICTQALNLFRVLTVYLKPVLPDVAGKVEEFFDAGKLDWSSAATPLLDRAIRPYAHLLTRVDSAQLDALFDTVAESAKAPAKAALPTQPAAQPKQASQATPPTQNATEITIDDFAKLDLRVAKIVAAEAVDGSDKLLKLTLDVGDAQRTVFSGIRTAYAPEQLVGRHAVVLANLRPRKMRFGTSEGMVLSAGPGGQEIFLLSPDTGATAGMKVS